MTDSDGNSMDARGARAVALRSIIDTYDIDGDEPVIGDEFTQERSYGWVFFYQSKRYVETGNHSHMLAGNGPVVVLRRDGSVHKLGAAFPVEETLRRFETMMELTGLPGRGNACPCCDCLTLRTAPPGTHELCPVCYWEDDGVQHVDPQYRGGANSESLTEARENYRRLGASSAEALVHVRPPLPHERPMS